MLLILQMIGFKNFQNLVIYIKLGERMAQAKDNSMPQLTLRQIIQVTHMLQTLQITGFKSLEAPAIS